MAQAQHRVEEAEEKLREAKAGRRESDRDRRARETVATLKRIFPGMACTAEVFPEISVQYLYACLCACTASEPYARLQPWVEHGMQAGMGVREIWPEASSTAWARHACDLWLIACSTCVSEGPGLLTGC